MFEGWRRWVDSLNPYQPEKLAPRVGLEPIAIEESALKRRAARYFLLAFVAFALWAFWAPLDAGVHVGGTVVVQGNRKAVQHPQGGVVQEILVREGSQVKQGDPLIRINPLSIQAELNSSDLEYFTALCEESRLAAERDMAPMIRWSDDLQAYAGASKVQEAKLLQQRLFNSRRQDLQNKQSILEEQVAGLKTQIEELQSILLIRKHQLELVSQDAASNVELANEGFVPRSRANELERTRSDLVASIANTNSEISKARSAITSSRLQMAQEKSSYLKEVDGLLKDAQQKRKSLRDKVEALRFNLSLTNLKAPVSGTVVGLKVFTVGGVIRAGDVLMEILPQAERLIVEAKVPTNLIDKVTRGMAADMRFTAFSQVTTPVIQGSVLLVGADKLLKTSSDDPMTPPEYYLAQIETTQHGYNLLGDNEIQPGMPVDVIIKSGERTFISYILKPLTDRFALSFKEN